VLASLSGEINRPLALEAGGGLTTVRFEAMASPCELVSAEADQAHVMAIAEVAAREAWRIEKKYSRYRDDSVVAQIHNNRGSSLTLDTETASLLDFAQHCFVLSEGLFDVTSGPLRHVWRFDGSDHLPSPSDVEALLPRIGFSKLHWKKPQLTVPPGMELDFGGIGKEYAVDRAFQLVAARTARAFLLNFGGDLRASGPHDHGPWQVGIERPGSDRQTQVVLSLERGALFAAQVGAATGHHDRGIPAQ